jgi:hypothetical protein
MDTATVTASLLLLLLLLLPMSCNKWLDDDAPTANLRTRPECVASRVIEGEELAAAAAAAAEAAHEGVECDAEDMVRRGRGASGAWDADVRQRKCMRKDIVTPGEVRGGGVEGGCVRE